jgi:hypothetical protein
MSQFASYTKSPETARPVKVMRAVMDFVRWLNAYGEISYDHQSFFAGPLGRLAKQLYYRNKIMGTAAVAPMILCEAFLPSARRLFHKPLRFPIADAHYAMGFTFLDEVTGETLYFQHTLHFLEQLKQSRCPQYEHYCWGYPFDWETCNGTITRDTPLITTTPYVYEAFLQAYQQEARQEWRQILESIVQHVVTDIHDVDTSPHSSTCSYTPHGEWGVINASAYRAFLLTSASQALEDKRLWKIAELNIHFVLDNQNPDGSWYYAVDGVRNFVDHFHTCFVMKALAKIEQLTGHEGCRQALARAVGYYVAYLFDEQGLPKPFSRAPRLTVYRHELYDYAECVNLCLLLRKDHTVLQGILDTVLDDLLTRWRKPDGSFRSRELRWGWDNVPMHRWAQSQLLRSLALYLQQQKAATWEGLP